ncbi:uncharacterized protein N7482_008717 [Penicillium canariense]|uniref:BTB domain-containing protein n=1 Tax=Penicillium canariense TaxID=189055 RepID=A0A9W9LJ07_9EURO|nr:uncharacterized protein N7482_008717 [Penicillium canariense]KAJ5157617.1 hypothetical protein N7482_008717 [Penicillium canariense]
MDIQSTIHDLAIEEVDANGDTILILSMKDPRQLFHCSSQALIATCDHFREKLAPGQQPHKELTQNGKVYLTIPDFEADCVLTILHIIHNPSTRLPEPLHPLRQSWLVARFNIYLKCQRDAQLGADFIAAWKEKAMNTKFHLSNTPKWMLISYTFRQEAVFRHTTALAQQYGAGVFKAAGLSIPKEVGSKQSFQTILNCL